MAIKCPKCHSENPETKQFCADCGTLLPSLKDIHPEVTETLQTPLRELTTGTTFAGRYQIIEELGKGGMGRVYKVFDADIKEKVALKLLKPEIASNRETIERFSNELKYARKISHRSVCRMHDLGKAEGTHFITMEYVSGEDLKTMIQMTGSLTIGATLSIGKQVCDGLAEAHSLGVVHRDLKPQNIMIDKGGNAKIMDFGIARSIKEKGITGPSVLIGTPEYMSPEQAEAKEVDHRSDIYSLGIILYEMATGRVPFEGETALSIAMKHKGEAPKDPRQLNPNIPEDLSWVILKCLEKDKAKRYQSAAEVRSELEKIEKGIPTTERVVPERKTLTSREITVKFTLRKLFVPALVLAGVIIIGVILWQVLPSKRVGPAPSGKPSLAIMYFENNTGDEKLEHWRKALSELIMADISQSKYLNVLSGDQLFNILKKENLLEAKSFSSEDLKKVAEQGRVENIIRGSYSKAGNTIRINAMLQNARTGEMLATEKVEALGEEGMFGAVDELTRRIKTNFKLTAEEIASDIDKNVSNITTSSPEAYKYYIQGREYHENGEYERSDPLIEKAISIDPGFAMAYRSLATSYYNRGFTTKYRFYMQKAMELSDRISNRERYLIQGDFYSATEKSYDKAIEAYSKVLELYPDDLFGNWELGVTYRDLEEWDKARERFEACIKLKVPSYIPYSNLADVYSSQGKYEKARQILFDYVRDFSDNALLHRDLAYIYLYQGKYDLAQGEANKAFSLEPTDYRSTLLNGDIHLFKGDWKEAEKEFLKSVEMAPTESKVIVYWRLANFYLLKGNFKNSIEQLQKALQLSQQAGEAWWESTFHFGLVTRYLSTENFGEALKESEKGWEKAVEADDPYWQRFVLHLKGLVYVRMKSLEKAQKTTDELRELVEQGLNKKEIRLCHHLLGLIELEKKNYSKSIEYLSKAVSSLVAQSSYSTWDALFHDSLARAYSAAGDVENARLEYERILALTWGRFDWGDIYARSFYNLGKIYEKQGAKEKAIDMFQKFLDLWKDADPGISEVGDARQRLAGLENY